MAVVAALIVTVVLYALVGLLCHVMEHRGAR
jgi:hypothetical protein